MSDLPGEIIGGLFIAFFFVGVIVVAIVGGSSMGVESSRVTWQKGVLMISPKYKFGDGVVIKSSGKPGKIVNSKFTVSFPGEKPVVDVASYSVLINGSVCTIDETDLETNKGSVEKN